MKRITIFNDGVVTEQMDDWPDLCNVQDACNSYLPIGSWYLHTGDWYQVVKDASDWCRWVPADQAPKEYRLLALLLT